MCMLLAERKVYRLKVMARRLHVSPEWLKAEAEAGRVPFVPAEPQYLFCPDAVEEALRVRASGQVSSSQSKE